MKDARLGISTPALLAKAVEKLDDVRMEDRDTKGDVYEYMLGKIATAGQNGQFRTPRHIIALMVELTEPTPTDIICDPAAGTCGFLVAAGEYLRRNHPDVLQDPKLRKHFHETKFNGFDFDSNGDNMPASKQRLCLEVAVDFGSDAWHAIGRAVLSVIKNRFIDKAADPDRGVGSGD
jgi:hypothetical protein